MPVAEGPESARIHSHACAALEIQVPVAGTKPGKEVIEILTTGALDVKAVKDADELLLTCNP